MLCILITCCLRLDFDAAWTEHREQGYLIPSCLLWTWSLRWCFETCLDSQNSQEILIFWWIVFTWCLRELGSEPVKLHSSHGYLIPSCFVAMCCCNLFFEAYSFPHRSQPNISLLFVCIFSAWEDKVLFNDVWKEHWEQEYLIPSCFASIWILRWPLLSCFYCIFYGISITQSGAQAFIFNLDKISLKKLFPTMNIEKVRIFNIENRKCANVRKWPCTGLWKWFLWLGNSILSNFYVRHLILGWIL